jgi:hypothetical protein
MVKVYTVVVRGVVVVRGIDIGDWGNKRFIEILFN